MFRKMSADSTMDLQTAKLSQSKISSKAVELLQTKGKDTMERNTWFQPILVWLSCIKVQDTATSKSVAWYIGFLI